MGALSGVALTQPAGRCGEARQAQGQRMSGLKIAFAEGDPGERPLHVRLMWEANQILQPFAKDLALCPGRQNRENLV